ncbi:SCO family protein [Sphingomicrobium sediminis]|uniref:SCO family protein n=1 Tax=Sphingomicrobium sediminis TaxID=2950949 RepID=A0A9X2EE74_9SPHN|nr:SCO family protein [Sphingomicrobium sediminis]MCM8556335.1 SCO family protein [Sphingomicrobium sediminis]
MMSRIRIVLWAAIAALLIGVGVFFLTQDRETPTSDMVEFGGPFTLVGSDGELFSSSVLDGRPHAIFFGFTNCPDVCPTTLSTLVRLRDQVGGAEAFDIVFITVDPERDGPEEVGRYADLFSTPIIGLTGSSEQIEQVMRQYGVAAIRDGETAPGNYNVNHTASVFLVDEGGKFVSTISPEEPEEIALQKLERIAL